jgi:hypothetical protein
MKFEILMVVKTLVTIYKTIQCHNPEDQNQHFHCNGNLKSQTVKLPASYSCVSVVTRCYSRWWSIQVLVMCPRVRPGTFTKAVSANTDMQFWYRYKSEFSLLHSFVYFVTKCEIFSRSPWWWRHLASLKRQ